MDKSDVDQLIKERIADAKLEVSEKRLQTVTWVAGGFLALFGVIIPFVFTSRSSDQVDSALTGMKRDFTDLSRSSLQGLDKNLEAFRAELKAFSDDHARQAQATSDKVDRAIRDMQSQFKELAGIQLRRPILECLVAGRSLDGSVLSISPNDVSTQLELRNSGDASARNIRVRIYVAVDQQFEVMGESYSWQQLSFSDEPAYKRVYEIYQPFVSLDAKESRPISIGFSAESFPTKSFAALLKIYYEQPEPKMYTFTINVGTSR